MTNSEAFAAVNVDRLSVAYSGNRVVNEVSFSAKKGEMLTLLGPSGCGKSTILRVIAGLERAESGRVSIAGRLTNDPANGINVPPEKRGIGMVFQSYAIWPHMTVRQNVSYPLETRNLSKSEINGKVDAILDLVELREMADRASTNLSGGQQQRVAIARALVFDPKLLLLDEPLSNLDSKLRLQMGQELRRIQKRTGVTTIYVTHDQVEALAMSDSIAVLRSGVIQQIDTPRNIYERPANSFVGWFIGDTNLIPARLLSVEGDRAEVAVEGNNEKLVTLAPNVRCETGDPVSLSIRPEDITCREDSGTIEAVVTEVNYYGERWHVQAQFQDVPIAFYLQRFDHVKEGQKVHLEFKPGCAAIFPRNASEIVGNPDSRLAMARAS